MTKKGEELSIDSSKAAAREMTPAEKQRADNMRRKAANDELAHYKKNVASANSLKSLQVEELELNIRYYKAKKEWFDLLPEVEKLEVEEKALIKKQKEERAEYEKDMAKLAEKSALKQETPKIIIPKVGKPRE